MIVKVLFVFFILLYLFAEGCTEGYTWCNSVRRKSNLIICGSISNGKGILDYHAWRLLEGVGIVGAIVLSRFFYSTNLLCFVFLLLGSWVVGSFIYERVLNYVVYGRLFPVKPNYILMWFSIKRSIIVESALLIIGIVLLILGFKL